MTVEELNHENCKRRARLLRQIAMRDQKIAALQHEKEQLRNELMHLSDRRAPGWSA